MTVDLVTIAIGSLLLAAAATGGGFSIYQVTMPPLSGWSRFLCLLLGFPLVFLGLVMFVDMRANKPAAGGVSDAQSTPATPVETGLPKPKDESRRQVGDDLVR